LKRITISFLIIGLTLVIFTSICARGNIDTSPPINVLGSTLEDQLVFTFLVNIVLNGLILMVPLTILMVKEYEAEISSIWPWSILLISLFGTFIDAAVFVSEIIPRIIGIILIGASYFLIIYFIMKQKVWTALSISIISSIVNYLCWTYVTFDGAFVKILLFLGIGYLAIIIPLTLGNMYDYYIRKKQDNKALFMNKIVISGLVALFGLYIFVSIML
jgi:hypothetical protein